MSDRILIRSSVSRWPAFLTGSVGVAFMIAGIIIAVGTDVHWAGYALGGVGLIMLFASFYIESQRISQLMWITLGPGNFTVTDNIGERSFNDDDIVSIALQYKDNFDNGNHTSTTRNFRVWVVASGDRPELIEMKGRIKVGEADPLVGFINRVVILLKTRADNELLKNQSVLGEGWELTSRQLNLRHTDKGELEVPLNTIAAAMNVEDKLKLWKHGEEEAFASIPLNAANAHLLQLMIEQELAKRPDTEKREQPTGQLGRILFERKPQRGIGLTTLIIAIVVAVIDIVIVALLIAGAVKRNDFDLMLGLSIGFAILSVVMLLLTWVTYKSLFRCHQFGVYLRGVTGEKKLLYSEVEAFTYSATKHYHNGAYIGTHLKLAFLPIKDLNKPKIVYKTTIKNADSSVDQLRDMISEMIGVRFVKEVMAGKSIEWTDALTLEPGLLRYRPYSLFGKNPPQTIPYSMISSHTLHQGTLSLFQRGKPKPFVTAGIASQNFFPGYVAFMMLWENARAHPHAIPVAQLEEADAREAELP